MFYTFIINTVLPHSTFNYKCSVFADLAFLQKVLLFPYFFGYKSIFNQFYLAVSKRC